MKSGRNEVWRGGALLAVAAVAVANLGQIVDKVPPAPVGVPEAAYDPLTAREERFRIFRAEAQRRSIRGTIGYFGDTETVDDEYYYAQFAVVPWPLDLNPAPHRWAVTDWRTNRAERPVPPGWRVEADCGAGVLLLRKELP